MSCVIRIALAFLLTIGAALAQFEVRGAFPVTYAYGVATGDFNQDGKLDIATGCFEALCGGVAVMLGNGDGTFRNPVYYTAGQDPQLVIVADFNNDGNLDILATDYVGGTVSVLLGNGDGTFAAAEDSFTPPGPTYAVAGDFNNDGKMDVAIEDQCQNSCVSVLIGNGDGTFGRPIDTEPPYPVIGIGVGDFNRDGKLDVVTEGFEISTTTFDVLLGNGNGTFTPGAHYPLSGDGGGVVIGDFRNNGLLDAAVTQGGGYDITVFLGSGDGTFEPGVNYATHGVTYDIASADLNNDGVPDLAVVGYNSAGATTIGLVTTFLGNGDGTFSTGHGYQIGDFLTSVVAEDANNDSQADLILTDRDLSAVDILLNTGTVSFSPVTPPNFPEQLVGTTSAPQTVTMTNSGQSSLTISSIKVSGQFGMTSTCGKSLASGASCTITSTFKPVNTGNKVGAVSIVDSASTKPQVIELTGSATVVSVSPTQLNFGTEKVNHRSSPMPVEITNTSTTTLQMGTISSSSVYFPQSNTCGSELAAGASCTVNPVFFPREKGQWSATLSINDKGGASPQTVTMSGVAD